MKIVRTHVSNAINLYKKLMQMVPPSGYKSGYEYTLYKEIFTYDFK